MKKKIILETNIFKAFLRLIDGGVILVNTDSHGKGVDFSIPDIVHKASFTCTSIKETCLLFSQIGLPKSETEITNYIVEVLNTSALAPYFVPHSL